MEDAARGQRLAPEEAEALWRAWSERRDAASRDKLVLSYAPMVNYLASRKVRELPARCELDDLVSYGFIALIEAVDRFDPAKGATFEQYAWTRVSGSIIDELRRQDAASRTTRRTARKADRARDSFYALNGRQPTEQELATALEMELKELRERLAEASRADTASLNAPTRTSDASLPVEVGDTVRAPEGLHEPELGLLASERSTVLREAIAELSDREREVLALVHVHEVSGAEIGALFGVSESRVSQIMSGIRAKLRAALAGYEEPVKAGARVAA
jgi:RNA polymerase sigma factor for flagellar operon FliA